MDGDTYEQLYSRLGKNSAWTRIVYEQAELEQDFN